jgi:hypothetical protein
MLFVGVAGVKKVVEHRDGLDDAVDGYLAERRNARRHDGNAAGKVLTHCGQWFEFGPRSYDDPKHAKPAEFYDGIAKKAVQRFDKDAEPWFAKPPAR